MGLLQTLRPDWWFSAHLHVRFVAVVKHGSSERGLEVGGPTVVPANPEEIVISDEDIDEDNTTIDADSMQSPDKISLAKDGQLVGSSSHPVVVSAETKFIALDKCLPRRDFLEVF